MTFIGAAGHALPFLAPQFKVAMTLSMIIVGVELFAIAWVRHKFMETPMLKAAIQIVIGGIIVFLAGIWIGQS
jgi:hypothetical protein